MGLDNPPGGPGKGPETPDKPTPPRTESKPPADASGGSQTPRIDSYVAAGQPVPGRPEAGTERRGDREAQPNGSSTDSSSNGPAAEKPQTPGDPPSEAEAKTEKEPETGKTEIGSQLGEERDHDADPTQPDNAGAEAEKPGQAKPESPRQDEGELGTGDRGSKTEQSEPGKAKEQDGGKDNGRTADDLAPSEQPSTRPDEASQFPPGSRRASLAATREQQAETAEHWRAIFQDTQPADGTGEGTVGGSGDSGAQPQNENAGSDGRGPEAHPPAAETPPGTTADGGTSSGEAPGDGEGSSGRDLPPSGTPEVEAEPPTQEVTRPQDQEHEPIPRLDSSGSGNDSGDPPTGPPADSASPADDQPQGGNDETPPGSEVGQPIEPAAEADPAVPEPGREASPIGPETPDQGSETPEAKAADGTTGDETDNPKPADETALPPEGTGENVTPPEASGDQSDGHGRTAEGPEPTEATDESNPPDREAEQAGEREESGTELTPHEEESTGIETSRFAGQVTITLDRDGRPIPPDRPDADTETSGRGELRRPEDDRASRDYQERKPDKLSRLRGELKKFVDKSDDTKEFVEKFSAPAQKKLERVKPTGQLCGARLNTDHIKAPDEKVKAGDTVLGAVGTAIVVTEIIRFGINIARNSRRREHADH
ncbi:hypothetical protein AB0C87_25890 [Actinomadura sp. NPDC048021]|uniref:hypothetical protein n=1 Tax=Actinomadura sp. NPDC048021 TaxID=3155385 RepID=UPI0033C49A2E